MKALLRLSRRLFLCSARPERNAPALRGVLRTAIIVQTPGTPFSEAVYILRADAVQQKGVSRAELLEQAREAAAGHAQETLPYASAPMLRPSAAFILGAAASLLALWALGLL